MMLIQKFLHSCILVEHLGQRLLIDPGEFCFIEGELKPRDLAQVDIILITHEHPDHFYPEAIVKISKIRKPIIITQTSVHKLLKEINIASEVLNFKNRIQIGNFTIEAVKAPHGPAITTSPLNAGFLINEKVWHPGDSIEFKLKKSPEVFALPIAAPWLITRYAIDAALKLKPKFVIPIHDAYLKDYMLRRIYGGAEQKLSQKGVVFKPLGIGDKLEISS